MGFTQTPTPALEANDWTDFISQVTRQRRGYIHMRLTDYFDQTTIPTIEEGSVFDLNGSQYVVDSDTAIDGWSGISNDTPIFIEIGGSPLAASWTTTAPTWDSAKGGWYNGNSRVVGGAYKGTGGDCEKKFLFHLLKFDQDGNVYFENDLNVESNAYIEGDVEIGDSLNVTNDIGAGSISTSSLETSGQVDFNADVDVNSTSTFTGTATFNGTILDKNGNEVLAMRAEYDEQSGSVASGGGYKEVTLTFSFSNDVQGIAHSEYCAYVSGGSARFETYVREINISGSSVTVYLRILTSSTGTTIAYKGFMTALTD